MVAADTHNEDDPDQAIFDEELKLAAEGQWDALGLDPPPPAVADPAPTERLTFIPATISDFLDHP